MLGGEAGRRGRRQLGQSRTTGGLCRRPRVVGGAGRGTAGGCGAVGGAVGRGGGRPSGGVGAPGRKKNGGRWKKNAEEGKRKEREANRWWDPRFAAGEGAPASGPR